MYHDLFPYYNSTTFLVPKLVCFHLKNLLKGKFT